MWEGHSSSNTPRWSPSAVGVARNISSRFQAHLDISWYPLLNLKGTQVGVLFSCTWWFQPNFQNIHQIGWFHQVEANQKSFKLRAGALRPIKSPKGTSTPWPQSFQGRHINIPKGTSTQRNPHGHGPMCWCRVTSYNTLKSILSYGKYVTKPT